MLSYQPGCRRMTFFVLDSVNSVELKILAGLFYMIFCYNTILWLWWMFYHFTKELNNCLDASSRISSWFGFVNSCSWQRTNNVGLLYSHWFEPKYNYLMNSGVFMMFMWHHSITVKECVKKQYASRCMVYVWFRFLLKLSWLFPQK